MVYSRLGRVTSQFALPTIQPGFLISTTRVRCDISMYSNHYRDWAVSPWNYPFCLPSTFKIVIILICRVGCVQGSLPDVGVCISSLPFSF